MSEVFSGLEKSLNLSLNGQDLEDSSLDEEALENNRRIFSRVANRKYSILERKGKKPGPPEPSTCEKESQCVICMDEMSKEVGLLDCNHKYCKACIENWASSSSACPICKIKSKLLRFFVGNCFMESHFLEQRALQIQEELSPLDIVVMNADSFCYKCDKEGNENVMLICNRCDKKCCHIYCLDPPLHFIPEDDWFCDFCVRTYRIEHKNPTAGIFRVRSGRRSRLKRSKRRAAKRQRGFAEDNSLENFIVKDTQEVSCKSVDSENSIFDTDSVFSEKGKSLKSSRNCSRVKRKPKKKAKSRKRERRAKRSEASKKRRSASKKSKQRKQIGQMQLLN